jgi:hypothetical protein
MKESNIEILRLSPADCFEQWDDIKPFIQMALEDQHYNAEDLKKLLLDGITRAYAVLKDSVYLAVVTAEIVVYPRDKVVRIHTAGGTRADLWAERMIDEITKDAKSNGATELQIIGRKGWLKVLDGFKQQTIVMGKSI